MVDLGPRSRIAVVDIPASASSKGFHSRARYGVNQKPA